MGDSILLLAIVAVGSFVVGFLVRDTISKHRHRQAKKRARRQP